jgi:hypothetical protein
MNRTILCIFGPAPILLTTALVAQDTEPTKEQIAAKCAAGGGCAFIIRNALMSIIRSASEAAYRQGAASCGKTI